MALDQSDFGESDIGVWNNKNGEVKTCLNSY